MILRSCHFVRETAKEKWFQNCLSDRFQRVKSGAIFSEWGLSEGVFPKVAHLVPNDMPVQVKHGPLLQFADDTCFKSPTCLVCCGDTNECSELAYSCWTYL